MPGPLFSFASYLGALLPLTPFVWLNVVLATLAIFLPSFFFNLCNLALLVLAYAASCNTKSRDWDQCCSGKFTAVFSDTNGTKLFQALD